LNDLLAFVERPARAFLRQRLGISIVERDEDVRDALPVELDALHRWGVGERLLEELLSGIEPRAALLAEIARGALPPGELGRAVIQGLWPQVTALAAQAQAHGGSSPPRSVETVVALAREPPLMDTVPGVRGGVLLSGTVSGVRGGVLLSATYSRLSARHRLAAWVRLLALTAAHPEAPFEAITIGRAGIGGDPGAVCIAQIHQLGPTASGRRARALSLLAALVDLRARGMREPLPLPCLTAAAYAQAARSGPRSAAQAAAQAVWRPAAFGSAGEDREPEHRLTFGGEISFAELIAPAPREDEQGTGWADDEPSRFARLARRLWEPLLACETLQTLETVQTVQKR
jgi:exodeoxyribonuclease V gamma subunit